MTPDLRGLDPAARRWLAAVRASVAVDEHASVASFHRAALELGRCGGPDRLVAGLERAAADERRHARLAHSSASAFAGRALGPRGDDGAVPVATTLAEVAARTVVEGCGEEARSLAAAVAPREAAEDPTVRAVLVRIVQDEARPVRLASRVVRWAVRSGGAEVAAAVRQAASRPSPALPGQETAPPALARWGVLGDDVLARIVSRSERERLAPARRTLAA